jgi:AraC-like DNA-binding protein
MFGYSIDYTISIIAVFLSIFMVLFFIKNYRESRSNRILAALMIVFALTVASSLINIMKMLSDEVFIQKSFFVASNIAFLIAPLIYMYVRSFLDPDFSFLKRQSVHLLPFAAASVVSALLVSGLPYFLVWHYPGRIIIGCLIIAQNMFYFILIILHLKKYGFTIKSFFINFENTSLSWMRIFTVTFVLLWIVHLEAFIGWDILKNPGWCPYATSHLSLILFIFFTVVLYFIVKVPAILSKKDSNRASMLSNEEILNLKMKIDAILIEERVYREPEITLNEMAKRIRIAPCHLSRVINESYKMNFNDFINRFRIDESKKLLIKYKGVKNIIDIAFESGFNSKSAFNNAFRKHVQLTPKEFQKKS